MGWFDSWWSGGDHLKDVDPAVRKFLEEQAPKSYIPESVRAAQEDSRTYRERVGLKGHTDPKRQYEQQQQTQKRQSQRIKSGQQNTTGEDQTDTEAPVPAESLFQDGRYKHLWKTYRPQADVEQAGKSDQEKLLDVVHGFEERQAEIGRAAMENCSNEQWAVHECFRSGSWTARATLCRQENQSLNRCLDMQKRFLKALGYGNLVVRPDGQAERIQMHADRLYQQMLKEEEEQKQQQKGEGREATKTTDMSALVTRMLATDGSAESQQQDSGLLVDAEIAKPVVTWEQLPEDIRQRALETRMKGLQGNDLEIAKRAFEQEITVNADLIHRINERQASEHQERLQRRAEGKERISDKIMHLLDRRKYADPAASIASSSQSSPADGKSKP